MSPHKSQLGPYPHASPPALGGAACRAAACAAVRGERDHDAESPAVREQLEALDDAMFAAIDGNVDALEKARALWFQAVCELPADLIDESREQYLRYAAEVTRRYEPSELRDPATAIVALEMFDIFTRE